MRSVLFGLSAAVLASGTANAERFTDPTIGLSIEKPADWCVLPPEAVAKDHRAIEADNPQLRGKTQNDAYEPVFAFTRYVGSYRGLTSTVKLGTLPAGSFAGHTGKEFLQGMLSSIRSLMPDAEVMTAPEAVSLAGKDAGHMALVFTLKAYGGSSRVASDMWAIPRGSYFVEVGATYPADDQTGDHAAIMKVIGSVRLAN